MKARILIVGGGAMGTSIAMHAATRCDPLREPVVLIEKNQLGSGSSGSSGGIVHQTYSDRVMAGMARDAVKVYSTFEQSTGRSVGYRRTGVMVIAGRDPEVLARFDADINMQTEIGVDLQRLEAEDIRRLVPGIHIEDGTVGAFEPLGGFLHPGRAIESIAALARTRGATTRTGVEQPEILLEGGRAIGVKTAQGVFYAPQIVLTTGAWTGAITSALGIELPLRLVRAQEQRIRTPRVGAETEDLIDNGFPLADSSLIDRDLLETRFYTVDPTDRLPVLHPVIADYETGFFARCHPADEQTRVGQIGFRGMPDVEHPSQLDRTEDAEFRRWAEDTIRNRLPVYEGCESEGFDLSCFSLTPDNRPIIGPIEEIPGLWVAAGFSGNDFHLAPSIGEGVTQMMLEQPVSAFDPEFFSLSRFQTTA
ncbi:MAG: sarcosine oxidase subunit beta [Planctomycetota bacterium]